MAVAPFGWERGHRAQRQPVLAGSVVATSQPLAAQAGLSMLARGGNAVDAAVAAAITLTVVEPTSNGIGGDLFAIVHTDEGMAGLNASGRAPAGIDAERLCGLGHIPVLGWDAVTVPGAVSGWVALSERFGRLEFAELFEPALRYARDGFPVSPVTAGAWGHAPAAYDGFPDFADAFLPPPDPGQMFRGSQQHALEEIAETHGASFYRGDLADRIDAHARATGGALRAEDLARHAPEWVEPLEIVYRGVSVCELPPNGQGIAALQALGILEAVGDTSVHHQVEAMKLALADAHEHIADPDWMRLEPEALLERSHLAGRAARIGEQAAAPGPGLVAGGGTVYLAAGDDRGTMVSLIQSNYVGFGSGIVVPGTGIALHNRGAGFVTDRDHPNAVGPGKRPFHTIIPGFLREAGRPLSAFGVMGGPMQAQGHIQVLCRILDRAENPQAAVDAPRWRVEADGALALEPGYAPDVAADLESRGHRLRTGVGRGVGPGVGRGVGPGVGMGGFGGAQLVWRLEDGALLGASDSRLDGQAVGC